MTSPLDIDIKLREVFHAFFFLFIHQIIIIYLSKSVCSFEFLGLNTLSLQGVFLWHEPRLCYSYSLRFSIAHGNSNLFDQLKRYEIIMMRENDGFIKLIEINRKF